MFDEHPACLLSCCKHNGSCTFIVNIHTMYSSTRVFSNMMQKRDCTDMIDMNLNCVFLEQDHGGAIYTE